MAIEKMEENMKRVVEQKMEFEWQSADIIDGLNINEQAIRLNMNMIKKYAPQKEISLRYAFGAIAILVAVIISMLGFFRCVKCHGPGVRESKFASYCYPIRSL